MTAAAALENLNENHGAARLSVLAVHQLPHNLTVGQDPEDATKACLYGLPTYSTEEQQKGRAMTMATDLARISVLVAPLAH
jgi:hypothetical protein